MKQNQVKCNVADCVGSIQLTVGRGLTNPQDTEGSTASPVTLMLSKQPLLLFVRLTNRFSVCFIRVLKGVNRPGPDC